LQERRAEHLEEEAQALPEQQILTASLPQALAAAPMRLLKQRALAETASTAPAAAAAQHRITATPAARAAMAAMGG
jgi:hypothetical protein